MQMEPVQTKFWPWLPVYSQNSWAGLVGKGIFVLKGPCSAACPE